MLVQLATDEAEDTFSHHFRKDGAKKDEQKPGVWVDLSRHTYYFPEALSSFSEVRGFTEQQLAAAQRLGKEYSSDYTGDGPSSSSTEAISQPLQTNNKLPVSNILKGFIYYENSKRRWEKIKSKFGTTT